MIPLDPERVEPKVLRVWRAENPAAKAVDFDESRSFQRIKSELRRHCNGDQAGLCVYCEQYLAPDAGHIEHIHPKSMDPSRTFQYSNLAHSCHGIVNGTQGKHCGHKKGDNVFCVPPGPGCNEPFVLSTDGMLGLRGRSGLKRVDRHNLSEQLKQIGVNSPSLVDRRRAQVERTIEVLKAIPAAIDEYLESNEFRHVLRQMLG